MRALKISLAVTVLVGAAFAARAGFFREGAVKTVREGAQVRVEFTGDAAGDLFDNLASGVALQRYILANRRVVDVIVAHSVTCAYFHPHREGLGILRNWPAEYRCRVDVSQYGAVRAVAASEILKSIGVEN